MFRRLHAALRPFTVSAAWLLTAITPALVCDVWFGHPGLGWVSSFALAGSLIWLGWWRTWGPQAVLTTWATQQIQGRTHDPYEQSFLRLLERIAQEQKLQHIPTPWIIEVDDRNLILLTPQHLIVTRGWLNTHLPTITISPVLTSLVLLAQSPHAVWADWMAVSPEIAMVGLESLSDHWAPRLRPRTAAERVARIRGVSNPRRRLPRILLLLLFFFPVALVLLAIERVVVHPFLRHRRYLSMRHQAVSLNFVKALDADLRLLASDTGPTPLRSVSLSPLWVIDPVSPSV